MIKIVLTTSLLAIALLLTSCGNSKGPLTEAEQAENMVYQ